MSKPKVAFYWCSSCGGCEESFVDLNEFVLELIQQVDVTLMPVATDFKYDDVRNMQDQEILVSFINGSVRTEEQEEISKLLRQKSKIIISYGSCSHLGGVPGLANFSDRESIFQRVYHETESTKNPDKKVPQTRSKFDNKDVNLPEFYTRVYSLNQIIDVDYYLPGCPPTPNIVKEALLVLLKGDLPPKGTVLTDKKALCKTCPRMETRPDKVLIKKFKRPYEVIDDGKCFLEQGLICMGPVTRGGCEARCVEANMPCRGCFGPTENVADGGTKAVSTFASLIESNDEKEIEEIIKSIADPAGLFYRYSLPSSMMQNKRKV